MTSPLHILQSRRIKALYCFSKKFIISLEFIIRKEKHMENECVNVNTETFDAGLYISENYEAIRNLISAVTGFINISATSLVEREDLIQEGFSILWF